MACGSECRWNQVKYLTWKRHDCRFSSLAAKNLRRTSSTLGINPEEGKMLTVDTCPAGSRTRRRASRRRAAQKAVGSSGPGSSSGGSMTALGTDCVVRSTWVYCQAKGDSQPINYHGTRYMYHRKKVTHFSVSCGCGMFEYPPSSNLCT